MTQMSFTLYIFHFFSLIYKNGSFLFISYFDGDGRGGDGELRIKRPWPYRLLFQIDFSVVKFYAGPSICSSH